MQNRIIRTPKILNSIFKYMSNTALCIIESDTARVNRQLGTTYNILSTRHQIYR